jgi:hypothetical protein
MTNPTPDPSAEMAETSPLMAFVVAVLSSLMSPSLNDQRLARLAAREALAAHRTSGEGELVTIAQIVGFALTALDTLRLSMPEALSLSMKLRLRGSANALNRSARDNTRILEKARRTAATPAPDAAIQEKPAPTPKPATQPLTKGEWGDAMKSVAVRLQTDAAIVSPAQRQTDALWIEALTGVAGELARTKSQTGSPGMGRAGLLRSTLMASDPGVPAHLFIGGKRKRA